MSIQASRKKRINISHIQNRKIVCVIRSRFCQNVKKGAHLCGTNFVWVHFFVTKMGQIAPLLNKSTVFQKSTKSVFNVSKIYLYILYARKTTFCRFPKKARYFCFAIPTALFFSCLWQKNIPKKVGPTISYTSFHILAHFLDPFFPKILFQWHTFKSHFSWYFKMLRIWEN